MIFTGFAAGTNWSWRSVLRDAGPSEPSAAPSGGSGGEADEVSRRTAALLRVNLLLICLGCNMRRSELQEFSVKLLVINLTDTEVSEATCLHYSLSHCHHT